MMPYYTGAVYEYALRNSCTPLIVESDRKFRLGNYFLPPRLIPATSSWYTQGAFHLSNEGRCAARTLTLRPAPAVSRLVHEAHETMQTSFRSEGVPRMEALGADCCRPRTERRLIALHIRTLWADMRGAAAKYRCTAPSAAERKRATDSLLALVMPPRHVYDIHCTARGIALGQTGCWGARYHMSLRELVADVATVGRRQWGTETPLSLFVASDSPAVRDAAVTFARELGLRSARTLGVVRHNNLADEQDGDLEGAAATTVADLLLLSQSDMLVTVSQRSTFPRAADGIAPCGGIDPQWYWVGEWHTLRPLLMSLLAPPKQPAAPTATVKAAPAATRETETPSCVRDCIGIDIARPPWPPEVANISTLEQTPLIRRVVANAARWSLACRHACACFFKAGLEGEGV